MESLAFHPSGTCFAMAGRLFKGSWNAAVFDAETGSKIAQLDTGMRVSRAAWSPGGQRLYLAGGVGQPKPSNEGKIDGWGRVKVFSAELG
ncbi:MAG: hypothetical protein R3F11_16395 [Verrucomicrobiales bacterium]